MRPIGWMAVVAVLLAGLPAISQDTAASKDFTFKRVKVGERKVGVKRGLVQIDPAEQERILAANPAVPVLPEVPHDQRPKPESGGATTAEGGTADSATSRKGAYAWYWDLVSPEIGKSRSGRMEAAIVALRNGPDGATVKAPRLNTLQQIADKHGIDILKATVGTDISPALALAVIATESAGKTAAVSSAGATGLMQLMPATAERFGVSNRTDASQNIQGGVAYLDWLLDHFDRDPLMALAGYNAGENAVRKHQGIPPYSETRDYVPKVVAAWSVAKGLCVTPPQLVTDGCVFRRGLQTASRKTN